MKVFTAAQMREFDRAATEEYSIPSIVLMENAALRVVEFLEMKFSPLREKRVVVLCGKGNNGGDGFAIARHLLNINYEIKVVLIGAVKGLQGDALINYQAVSKATEIEIIADNASIAHWYSAAWHSPSHEPHVIIDALMGTGFQGELRKQNLGSVTGYLRGFNTNDLTSILSIDIPSGLNADTGETIPHGFHADYTITFAAPKRGMFLRAGLDRCGEVWIGDIGTPDMLMFKQLHRCECIMREHMRILLPQRLQDAHKGDAGRVLLIGGSYGMSGAPTLAAKAVLKSGAGLCIAALPDKIISTFQAAFSEATSHPLPCDEAGVLQAHSVDELSELWKNADAVAIGPGIGRAEGTLEFVRRVARECPQPLILDADALYALRAIEADLKNRTAPTILTPHPGEMGELMAMKTQDVNDNRIETAIACAQKYNAIVVLKGARSIVALPDGNTHINLTGNAGMATGGSGDVLTGTIAGLLAQTKDAVNATLLGVYLHGMAGDLAFQTLGNGLIAGDIAENIPRALVELSKPIAPPINARLRKLE